MIRHVPADGNGDIESVPVAEVLEVIAGPGRSTGEADVPPGAVEQVAVAHLFASQLLGRGNGVPASDGIPPGTLDGGDRIGAGAFNRGDGVRPGPFHGGDRILSHAFDTGDRVRPHGIGSGDRIGAHCRVTTRPEVDLSAGFLGDANPLLGGARGVLGEAGCRHSQRQRREN